MTEFEIKYWDERVEQVKNKDANIVICKGTVYQIGDGKSFVKGFDGARFKITFKDGREAITEDLWLNDKVPEEYKDKLQDNATSIERIPKEQTNNLVDIFLGGN